MTNYQLYRTNVLLGGLVCWDIVLDSDLNQLFVDNFHVAPVNKKIPYNYKPDRYELNNDHQTNIKNLYNNIVGNFYSGYIEDQLTNDYPIISDLKKNTHVNEYEIGCVRVAKKTYNKQFAFFCPIWLEQLKDDDVLSFTLIFSNPSTQEAVAKKSILFKYSDSKKVHNNFVDYFKNYIKYTGIEDGTDDVLNINLSNKTSYLSGLEVNSGNNKVVEITSLAKNILSRERPLMEFNSMIINSFKLYNSIAKLLFNFKFYFDPEDILPMHILHMINWAAFNISIEVYINGNPLPQVDMYSNFDNIPKKYSAQPFGYIGDTQLNVLDYLLDNKCITLLNLNKIYQPIIHWSLADSNKYIFNVYEGFSGFLKKTVKKIEYIYGPAVNPWYWYHFAHSDPMFYIKHYAPWLTSSLIESNKHLGFNGLGDSNKVILGKTVKTQEIVILNAHLYEDAPDLIQPDYSKELNNTGWCTTIDLNNGFSDIPLQVRIDRNGLHELSFFDLKGENIIISKQLADDFRFQPGTKYIWNHNVKYDLSKIKIENPGGAKILLCHLYAKNGSMNNLISLFEESFITEANQNDVYIGKYINSDYKYQNKILYYIYFLKVNLLILVSTDLNMLTFANIKKYLKQYLEDTPVPINPEEKTIYTEALLNLQNLYKILINAVMFPVVTFNNSLSIKKTPSPSLATEEIEYYKSNNVDKIYLMRYDGKIKPTFLSLDESINKNLFNYKLILSKKEIITDPIYSKYMPLKFLPKYPSINYYPIKYKLMDYMNPYDYIHDIEYKWYNNSKIILAVDTLNFDMEWIQSIEKTEFTKNEFEDYLIKYILKTYNIPYELTEFIKKQYEYFVLDDYIKQIPNSTKIIHIYKIKLNLL